MKDLNGFTLMKFGGTSMGNVEAMTKAARIVTSRENPRLIVVSATSGTTNQLLKIHGLRRSHAPEARSDLSRELSELRSRHLGMAKSLGCDSEDHAALEAVFLDLETTLDRESREERADLKNLDRMLSVGERLSAILFARAVGNEGKPTSVVDARKYLRTDDRFGKAEPYIRDTARLCAGLRAEMRETEFLYVTEGFIGSDEAGETTTLGRGGSDYSAALFGEALGAGRVEIWTDVPGILTMDPRVVPQARVIAEIGFAEAAEMANFGAKVLHPATLAPAMRAGIRVSVLSTFDPLAPGTVIVPGELERAPLIRAIAVRKRQTLITVGSLHMLNAQGFLAKLFAVLSRHHLSVDLVTTSEVSVALTVDEDSLGSSGKPVRENQEMLDELRTFADVRLEEGLSLIALIGNRLNQAPGVAARVFDTIRDFNVRLICHGASEHNICFLVESSEDAEIARRLHVACVETG